MQSGVSIAAVFQLPVFILHSEHLCLCSGSEVKVSDIILFWYFVLHCVGIVSTVHVSNK